LKKIIQMIRTIITADGNDLTLKLPDNFLGKEVEIIAFVIEDTQMETTNSLKEFSVIELDTRNFKFDREEANER